MGAKIGFSDMETSEASDKASSDFEKDVSCLPKHHAGMNLYSTDKE